MLKIMCKCDGDVVLSSPHSIEQKLRGQKNKSCNPWGMDKRGVLFPPEFIAKTSKERKCNNEVLQGQAYFSSAVPIQMLQPWTSAASKVVIEDLGSQGQPAPLLLNSGS